MKMKSVLAAALLATAVFTTTGSPVRTSAAPAILLEGNPVAFTQEPKLAGGVLVAPARDLAAAFGMNVAWDNAERAATFTNGDVKLKLTADSDYALLGDQAVTTSGMPYIENGTLLVPVRFFAETLKHVVRWDSATGAVAITRLTGSLPVVGTADHLLTLLTQNHNSEGIAMKEMAASGSAVPAASGAIAAGSNNMADAKAESAPRSAQSGDAADYSKTNLQVEGVDESDIVKNDGTFIYQVSKNRIVVSQAYPADQMKVISTLTFDQESFQPREMYVDDKHLIVVGQSYTPASGKMTPANEAADRKIMIYPPQGRQTTKVMVYDLSDKSRLNLVKEAELEGYYVSSRKVGSSLYFIANKNVNYYIMNGKDSSNMDDVKARMSPSYRDSLDGENFTSVPLDQVYYLPKAVEPSYVLIGGLELNHLDQKVSITAYLGSGQNVYASEKNMYVAVTEYGMSGIRPSAKASPSPLPQPYEPPKQETVIYQFALNGGKTEYKNTARVPGRLLNQFSMDEYNGYFRLTTTTGEAWGQQGNVAQNNLYILDSALKQNGKIENIAPGERIYSTRFMGDRAYMVTFKNVDPLFVIDVKDPADPKILGALKIPGYSDYLQPYDENHLIGFGKDTVELSNKGVNGTDATTAFYQGMKIALFDVTDVNHPQEMYKESIGDRGTDSELLHNHKALLFDKEKNLLSFPVQVMQIDPNEAPQQAGRFPQYGKFAFQGAYVYNLDLAKGFQLKGKITHIKPEEQQKAGEPYFGDNQVQRVLYIGDTLYTVSAGTIKANDLSTLEDKNTLLIP